MNSSIPSIVRTALMGAGFLALIGCGESKGSDPDPTSSAVGSSSSVYVPPVTDPTSGVIIRDFRAELIGAQLFLYGTVSVSDQLDSGLVALDSLVFGVAPAGPVVVATGNGAGRNQVDLNIDLAAYIDLMAWSTCGHYEVYLTGFGNNKPATDTVQFEKPQGFCPESSSSTESSSSAEALTLRDTTITFAAQGRAGIHGIDLDTRTTYTGVTDIQANQNTVDLLFGALGAEAYLMTPLGTDLIATYAAVASGSTYPGAIYQSNNSGHPSLITSSTQLVDYRMNSATQSTEVYTNEYFVVRTERYNEVTLEGLYLVQVQGGTLSSGPTTESPLRIWWVQR